MDALTPAEAVTLAELFDHTRCHDEISNIAEILGITPEGFSARLDSIARKLNLPPCSPLIALLEEEMNMADHDGEPLFFPADFELSLANAQRTKIE